MKSSFVLDAQTIAIVTGVFIPLITGLITKVSASNVLKSLSTLFLSAIAGWFAVAQAGVSYGWREVLVGIFYAFGTSVVSYYGFTKPSGIAPAVHNGTANFGLGKAA